MLGTLRVLLSSTLRVLVSTTLSVLVSTTRGVLLFSTLSTFAYAQVIAPNQNETVLLVAHPGLRDAAYRQTVVLAAPLPEVGGHIGVIINRPTRRTLITLFPNHAPSQKVVEPVLFGGPFSPSAVVALIRSATSPGVGSIALLPDLYMSFRATVIDQIIETDPNSARYYVGYVLWRPGELRSEVDRGVWAVMSAERDTVFRNLSEMDRLWEELLQQSRRLQASYPSEPIASRNALVNGTSSVIPLANSKCNSGTPPLGLVCTLALSARAM